MVHKKFIYDSGGDAVFYLFIFLASVIAPTILSLAMENPAMLLITLFINSVGLIREYLNLYKYKKTFRRFWWERLIGILTSSLIATYSFIAMFVITSGVEQENFFIPNLIFSVLLFSPGVISAIEGILYIKEDFDNNSIPEERPIVDKNTSDV